MDSDLKILVAKKYNVMSFLSSIMKTVRGWQTMKRVMNTVKRNLIYYRYISYCATNYPVCEWNVKLEDVVLIQCGAIITRSIFSKILTLDIP